MNAPPLASLNLNSLVALDALLTECNVTRAARRVRITQPAMSQTLARLRELFDDPLLVRQDRGLVRTPRAEAMLHPLAEALQSVERAIQLGMGFDPATSKRVFRVAMTDLHATTTLPGLLASVSKSAPEVGIQAEAMSMSSYSDRIGSGEVDLAVGFLLRTTDVLAVETLMVDDYVCLVRKGHPLAKKKRITMSEFAKQRHVANTPAGYVPRAMSAAGSALGVSRIRASLPYLLPVPSMVRNSDLVATVPKRLLTAPVDLTGLVALEPPEELPQVAHSMWWHPRFDRDPAHRWLRERVREGFRA